MPVANQIEYKGKIYTLRQLSEETGLSKATLNSRLEAGWGIEKAVETPLRITTLRKYPYHGKMLTAAELAALNGTITTKTMRERLNNGMSPEQAVMEPKTRGGKLITRKEVDAVPVSGGRFVPHISPADMKKCKKCRYAEKDSGGRALCAYIILHDPPERRGCEPGKNCTRWEPRDKKTEQKKLNKWIGASNL